MYTKGIDQAACNSFMHQVIHQNCHLGYYLIITLSNIYFANY